MQRKSRNPLKILVIISVIIVAVVAFFATRYYLTFKYENVSEKGLIVNISSRYDYNAMMEYLHEQDGWINWKRFERSAEKMELSTSFKPGRYVFQAGVNNEFIIRSIINNWESPLNIVISGRIRSNERLAMILGKQFDADSSDFITILNDNNFRDSLGFSKYTYLSMFIPNTYEMYWTASPESVLMRLRKEYDTFWNEDRRQKAVNIGMTPFEVSALASIVTEESNYAPEQPTIAGVYINRIKKGIKLQADPTVVFAINDPTVRRVLNSHLKIDSPYNTYKYKGLPPGPIAVPSISSIDAVLNYEKHNYVYFCARPELDGRHNFSASYNEHLRNARKYRKAIEERNAAQ